MDIPEDLKYTREHEWVRIEDEGEVVIGITDYAQEQLGDIVFIELPEADAEVDVIRDEPFAVIESVKAASDVYSPITGQVIEINDELPNSPDVVNEDCYGDGWLLRMKPANREETDDLLSPDDYRELIDEISE